MEVTAPAQYGEQESEPERCQGERGEVGKQRQAEESVRYLVNNSTGCVKEKEAAATTLRIGGGGCGQRR